MHFAFQQRTLLLSRPTLPEERVVAVVAACRIKSEGDMPAYSRLLHYRFPGYPLIITQRNLDQCVFHTTNKL